MVVKTDDAYDIISILKDGGIGILRTDTLYGIVADARSEAAVERIYQVKGRTPTKPPIILIASVDQMFTPLDDDHRRQTAAFWPGKNSVIVPAVGAPKWLVRDGDSLAYRIPADDDLRQLLEKTGPLVAPSANPEGQPPAMTIDQAIDYFGDKVDFYVNGGEVTDDTPSKLYRLVDNRFERLR